MIDNASPGSEAELSPASERWVQETLASLSLREKVGQLIMPWVGGEYTAVDSPEFEALLEWVEDEGVGGLVMSIGLPHSYAAKLNELQQRADVPLLITADMENGSGMRLAGIYSLPHLLPQGGGTVFPPVMALGATRSDSLAYALGKVLGQEARAVGVHMTFGPVMDVNSNPLNPIINTRSFGESPELVARLGTAYIRGARDAGLMSTAKHFPGHGDTEVDSHIDLPKITADRARLDSVELPPFRAAIDAGVDGIMTAHIAVVGVLGEDAPPATLSPYFMTDVLREEMGFEGLLFTDAMTMGGIADRYGATEPLVMAIEAGADVLLMPRDVGVAIETVLAAVRSGRLSEARIDESVERILTAKARAGLIDGRLVSLEAVDEIVATSEKTAVAAEVAERSITLARDTDGLVPIVETAGPILSVTYAKSTDLIAGRTFDRTLAQHLEVRSVRVDERTTPEEYEALRARADSAARVIVSVYVSPREFEGSVATDAGFSAFVEGLSASGAPVIALSFGTPYLLRFFPSVPAYMLAWGGAEVSQRAAARALLGETAITGRLPISLPPYYPLGAGLTRAPFAEDQH
ncbi:MAG TPA: glycoside hydrolase family 3 N-terminal domain-containing protein [Longimicrobiaceae bacterium]|nr:glycoside hydrolase family 3 N-terminal domain-containing protein [Longimicrobiaceae bacterium]